MRPIFLLLFCSQLLYIDLPEETPTKEDALCGFVRNDTIFIQHFHNYPFQKGMFKYTHQ